MGCRLNIDINADTFSQAHPFSRQLYLFVAIDYDQFVLCHSINDFFKCFYIDAGQSVQVGSLKHIAFGKSIENSQCLLICENIRVGMKYLQDFDTAQDITLIQIVLREC